MAGRFPSRRFGAKKKGIAQFSERRFTSKQRGTGDTVGSSNRTFLFGGDPSPGGASDALLLGDGSSGLLLGDGASYLNLGE